MKKILSKTSKKETVVILVFTALLAGLIMIPTGYERQIYLNAEGVSARVIEVNNAGMYHNGLIHQGSQTCTVVILSGVHKNEKVTAVNLFSGKLEFDKIFTVGDTAWVLLERDGNNAIVHANMVEHFRLTKELLLIALFALCLVVFLNYTGIRTLLSFAISLLSIWKILIPCMLNGINPILIALATGSIITVTTLLLVAGFTRKAFTAIAGALACSLITCVLAMVWGDVLMINGAVMQWSESLLYAGYQNLDLTLIFQAGIYLASSGAILDVAVDISSALDEVVLNNPAISRKALVLSGLTIGRSVVGSQTTTLLLAYMGSYISILMVFMAQGTPLMNILNSKMAASEILHTFVGCIGLIFVSPLTSAICGVAYKKDKTRGSNSKTGQIGV